jgi:hypothetical protein
MRLRRGRMIMLCGKGIAATDCPRRRRSGCLLALYCQSGRSQTGSGAMLPQAPGGRIIRRASSAVAHRRASRHRAPRPDQFTLSAYWAALELGRPWLKWGTPATAIPSPSAPHRCRFHLPQASWRRRKSLVECRSARNSAATRCTLVCPCLAELAPTDAATAGAGNGTGQSV